MYVCDTYVAVVKGYPRNLISRSHNNFQQVGNRTMAEVEEGQIPNDLEANPLGSRPNSGSEQPRGSRPSSSSNFIPSSNGSRFDQLHIT